MDRAKVVKGLEICSDCGFCESIKKFDLRCPYRNNDGKGCDRSQLLMDALSMLKEQEAVVKQWKKEIADNQLAHAPKDSHEFMTLDEHLENEYKRGIWDGLQIAWNIISEGW